MHRDTIKYEAGIIKVVDSHTEGEPTRVIVEGGPDLGGGTVADKARVFREKFDWVRSAVIREPRGFDALVGAMIVPATSKSAVCGVIFFNNVGFLNACGHGTMGLGVTLRHLGIVQIGTHIVETPVGEARIHLAGASEVTIDNVPVYRHAADVELDVMFEGTMRHVRGDVAWGGNWFFLGFDHGVDVRAGNIEQLTRFCQALKRALKERNITGKGGAEIDHIELFGPALRHDCDCKNFVLCPGDQYDRSPCGTGLGAKLACLHASGKLAAGATWNQESVIGSRFSGRLRHVGEDLIPTISGHAFVCAESRLILHPHDPFVHGIRM